MTTASAFTGVLRIATRQSPLALWQAEHVKAELCRYYPDLEVRLVSMTTEGDRQLGMPLREVGGKGLFIKELERAMIDGVADIAVHSMKDVPAILPEGFVLPVIAWRDDVRDAIVGCQGLDQLPHAARVGSSSLRRAAQVLARRPDLNIVPIRGNVGTRLGKLADGEVDALLLAAAGLKRLGLAERIDAVLEIHECLPAAGQGALGIECREDSPVRKLLEALADDQVARCVNAERAVSRHLGADCSLPVAAYAREVRAGAGNEPELTLEALIADARGKRIVRATASGTDSEAVAAQVVAALDARGAQEVLAELRRELL